MKTRNPLALLLIASLLPLSPAQAQVVDNAGSEFFVGFMPNWDELGGMTTELHLTSDVATEVTVHYPANAPAFTVTVAVRPDSITTVDLGPGPAFGWTPGAVSGNAVRAFSDGEFVVYAVNRRAITTDAAVALPVDALGTEYIVQTYIPSQLPSLFAVVATRDSTTVTITPTADVEGGHAAGTPFHVTLNRGEGFLGRSVVMQGPGGDLSGTLIASDRPVQVSNGDTCTLVPQFVQSCNHLFEIAQPVQAWGREVIAAPVPERPSGAVYRVLASEDDTAVQQNGVPVGTLDRGGFFETPYVAGAQTFSGDKPVFVTQYVPGNSAPETEKFSGDPSMGSVLPREQYLQRYTFSTVGGSRFERNYVSVIAQDGDVAGGTLLLDGAPVPAAAFTAVPGTGYSYAVLAIPEGTHTTSSAGFHGITVSGFDDFDSYLFAGGATFAAPTAVIPGGAPRSFGLEQNAPNPFGSTTRIPFVLVEAAPVRLAVYDVLGREIATLVEGTLPAGAHEAEWRGEDAAGRQVPSGVYLYRIEAGRLTAARRMTLVR